MIASTVLGGWCALPAWAGEPDPKPAHVRGWRTRATAGPEQKAPLKTRLKAYAFRLLTRYAWRGGEQFRCLDSLWTRESNWNHRAKNPTSGAYGIPQALPAGKMRKRRPGLAVEPADADPLGAALHQGAVRHAVRGVGPLPRAQLVLSAHPAY